VSPMNEKTYQFLDDLYSEQAPRLNSKFFNVCCDETEGLGTGPSQELAAKIGVGGVYTRHLRRLYDLLRDNYRKRMMMWGDIILNHPGNLADLPKDTIMLTWAYDPRGSFEAQITPFARSGYEFFVCPGVSCWGRVLPDFQVSVKNIANFVRDGAKQNALGMLNTTWDDTGENLAGPNWYGIAWGAECSWNAATTPVDAFDQRVGAVLFGQDRAEFGEAIELLGTAHRLPAFEQMSDSAFWKTGFAQLLKDEKNAVSQAEALQGMVRMAKAKLDAARKSALVDADILDSIEFGAERMGLMATRIIEGRLAVQAYRKAALAQDSSEALPLLGSPCAGRVRQIRDAHAALKQRHIELWNRENRPYALDVVTRRYDAAVAYYDGVLKRLISAEEDLKNHRPLPPAEKIGFPGAPAGGN
jgi:hexosaminidase